MTLSTIHSVPAPRTTRPRFARFRRLLTAALAALALPLSAATVNVPNASFEGPAVQPPSLVSTTIDSWQKTPDPGFPLPPGYTWNDLAGVFLNTPSGASDHIDNMDGNQAVYMLNIPTLGIFQDLTATYSVGMSYNVTLGVIGGGGGMPVGSSLLLGLFYRDGGNNIVNIGGGLPIVHSLAAFPNNTHFQDFTLSLPAVQAGDAWAGRNIGLQIFSTGGNGVGYWDLDNVRFEAVPEPGTIGLLALGAGGLMLMRLRKRRGA